MAEAGVNHSAGDQALGFFYQPIYGLLRLLESDDDEAAVCVETLDDLVLEGNEYRLLQLKHTTKGGATLTVKSDDLWRTLRAWIDVQDRMPGHHVHYILVTVADVPPTSPLVHLVGDGTADAASIEAVISALVGEAERVRDERVQALAAKKPLPHEKKFKGCASFLELTDDQRRALISATIISPKAPSIEEAHEEVMRFLGKLIPKENRSNAKDHLFGWWEYRVVKHLVKKTTFAVTKAELTEKIVDIIKDLSLSRLSIDVDDEEPPPMYRMDDLIVWQIEAIGGSERVILRTKKYEWMARNQRALWVQADVSNVAKIGVFDERLVEEWDERFSAAKTKVVRENEADCRVEGMKIFSWVYREAPTQVEPIDLNCSQHFLIRGTYYILSGRQGELSAEAEPSDKPSVGWHPFWEEMLEDHDKKY